MISITLWRPAQFAPSEVPRRDPAERRPLPPELKAQRRETMLAYRERQRARKAGKLAAERGDAAGANITT